VGFAVGMIRAAPQLAGLLRIGAPAFIGRWIDRKRFCLGAYLLSALALLGVPLLAMPGWLPSDRVTLALLVALWGVYHLLEYLGSVALWSWIADLVPQRIRGAFLGRRERWMVTGQAAAFIASGVFIYAWRRQHPLPDRAWIGYALPAAVGAGFMLLAVLPLARMPGLVSRSAPQARSALAAILAPLADSAFLRLLAFGCWFSISNGITLPVQEMYPRHVLAVEYAFLATSILATAMRCGQWLVSPRLGRLADRWGNRPVMIGSLAIVAAGPLFFFLASPARPAWLAGAWIAWIAFAGLNVCLPNLTLKLAPPRCNASYIATYYAVTGLCMSLATVAGGRLYDLFGRQRYAIGAGLPSLDYAHAAFLASWLLRSLGVLLLLWVVIEPRPRCAAQQL
jgi:MFS family permease